MTATDLVPLLVSDLVAARYLEDAAEAAARTMLSAADAALRSSPHPGRGRVLRGVVHLRPGDGYRRLWALEHEPGGRAPGLDAASLHSATAWRWVAERGTALTIDIALGMARSWTTDAPASQPTSGGCFFNSTETRQRLLQRDATHLHVLPLYAPGHTLEGMISIEVTCPPHAVEAFCSLECRELLSLLASIASPYLTALPLRPAIAPRPDDLMPVIGAATAGLVDLLSVFAEQEETLLITGPTGSGKSRLARFCHARSRRRTGPFEGLDLLSVPEDLQMAELFGWKRGAFTGAVKDSPGAIARAEGGTLFIDEIDKLSLKAQGGLLRFLEERAFRPLGDSSRDQRANVRVVVGSNAILTDLVRSGAFREDLYYRINVLPVRLLPLSERRDEIPAWADYMLARRHREAAPAGDARFTQEALRMLADRAWPGNLRELDNIVRRAYAIALSQAGVGTRHLVVEAQLVRRALAFDEEARSASSLSEQLRKAAIAFVREAERRGASGLPLDLADGYRGLVLGAAVRKLGDRDAALELLGQGGFVRSRNQHKILRREMDRVQELLRALGENERAELDDLVHIEGEH